MSPTRRVEIQTRRGLVVAAVVAFFAFPAAAYIAGQRVSDQCDSINRVVDAGAAILNPETQLEYARDHRLISPAEYDAQLARTRKLRPLTQHYLTVWRASRCQ